MLFLDEQKRLKRVQGNVIQTMWSIVVILGLHPFQKSTTIWRYRVLTEEEEKVTSNEERVIKEEEMMVVDF
jgi:hypothetical protein